MDNLPDIKFPGDYPDRMFIPLITFDLGVTWHALEPSFTATEMKRRLKSFLPSPEILRDNPRFANVRCATAIIPTNGLKAIASFTEFPVEDLVVSDEIKP